jgi:hypothetical protein
MDTNCFSPKPLRNAMQKAGQQGRPLLALRANASVYAPYLIRSLRLFRGLALT